MALGSNERDLLVLVAHAEQDRMFRRLEGALGVRWSMEDLVKEKTDGSATPPGAQLPSAVRLPMLSILAPDMFGSIRDDYRQRYLRANRGAAAGTTLVEVGHLDRRAAKSFFKDLE
jgi:hypothetical protein